jgi:hypothetical protein
LLITGIFYVIKIKFAKDYSAVQLGSKAIAAAVEKTGLPQQAIEEVPVWH